MANRCYEATLRKRKPLPEMPTDEQIRASLNRSVERDSWRSWSANDVENEIHCWLGDYPDLGFDGFWTAEATWIFRTHDRPFKLLTLAEASNHSARLKREQRRQPFLDPETIRHIGAARALLCGLPHPEGMPRNPVRASAIKALLDGYCKDAPLSLGAVILAALSRFLRIKRIPGSADCIVNLDERFLNPRFFVSISGGSPK
jgi:hypothetical protein